jgi:hypothetical protein
MILEVPPSVADRHSGAEILLSVDLRAKVLHLALCVRLRRELVDVTDSALALYAQPVVIEFAPPVNPDIWALGTLHAFDRPLLITG